jgi:adenine-specific DNA-methyltransferase
LIIEGDNLEVLKLLQKSYLGKVKMIYIDPPYNTGNEFIYPDDFAESLHTYMEYTGQLDSEGRRFGTNTEADGRFHSRWMNMMLPRLYFARNLLREDGAVFVSIDDHEVQNLRVLLNEVFGEENFVASIIWQKVYAPKNTARFFSEDHDYVLCYAKNAEEWSPRPLPRSEEANAHYDNPDDDPRGPWRSDGMSARNYYSKGQYTVTGPTGRKFDPPKGRYWGVPEDKFKQLDQEKRIWWGKEGNGAPAYKRFLSEVKQGIVPQTLWMYEDVGHTQEAKKELLTFVPFEDTDNVLDTVKPTRLIRRMLQIATAPEEGAIVMDFFAGSGSTGHAVLAQNQEDGGNRRFVLVQLPEPLPTPESKLKTIADITRTRVRNAIKAIDAESNGTLTGASRSTGGLGYRGYALDESSFQAWSSEASNDREQLLRQMELHLQHVRDGRTEQDLLFEILLKSGFPLTSPVETLTLAGKRVYIAAGGALMLCLERSLTMEVIRAIADKRPERVVCLDAGFAGNDQLKTNAVQIFKTKGVGSFKTV